MLGLDTNVLIRYLMQDDRRQYEKARRLIHREAGKGEPVLVSLLVLLEIEWVLRSRYGLSKEEILAAFSALLEAVDLAFEDETSVEYALYSWSRRFCRLSDRSPQSPTGLPRHGDLRRQGTQTCRFHFGLRDGATQPGRVRPRASVSSVVA
jgi:predicted nucleic-acid-binding protein